MNQIINSFRTSAAGLAGAVAVAAGIQVPGAVAQDEELLVLEEVIVTARKIEQNVMDVPVSMSVLDDSAFKTLGATNIADLGFSIPNTVVQQTGLGTSTNVRIRGIGDVGVYVDEVVLGTSQAYNTALSDVERVEVLRGPQGTVFGRNTMGGVINTVTRTPTEETDFNIDVTYGDYDLIQVRSTLGGEITDNIYGRASIIYREREGYTTNRVNGDDYNGEDVSGGRLRLRFLPTDSLELNWSLDYFDTDTTGGVNDLLADQPTNEMFMRVAGPFPYEIPTYAADDGDPQDHKVFLSDIDAYERSESWGTWFRVDYEFSDIKFVSLTSYGEVDRDSFDDIDKTPDDFGIKWTEFEYDQWSQEFRFSSSVGEDFHWLVGAYYFESEGERLDDVQLESDCICPGLGGFTIGEGNAFGFLPEPFLHQFLIDGSSAEDLAVFGHINWDFSDRWFAEAGLRYSEESLEKWAEDWYEPAIPLLGLPGRGQPGTQNVREDLTNDDWSGMASLSFRVSDYHTAYGSISNAQNRGGFNFGFNFGSLPDSLQTYGPEKVTNYELGIKGEFGSNWSYSAAIFYMDYDDKHQSIEYDTGITGIAFPVQNVGQVDVNGAEFSIAGRPTDALNLYLDVGWQESEFKDVGADADLKGNELAFTPEWTVNSGANYLLATDRMGEFDFGVQIQYREESWLNANNTFVVPDATLYNASIAWNSPNGNWTITGRGLNLGDDIYYTNANLSAFLSGVVSVNATAPRRWTLEVRYDL